MTERCCLTNKIWEGREAGTATHAYAMEKAPILGGIL
nr:MAG TPA: hypothetical protein [Caudoviricetes sp.]